MTTTHISDLKDAIESRDADRVTAWYTDGARLTVLDRDHPPAAPTVLSGVEEIRRYYADICARNVDHEVRDLVATDDTLAFVQHCRYPDGARVVCVTVAHLENGRISSQTAAQVWD